MAETPKIDDFGAEWARLMQTAKPEASRVYVVVPHTSYMLAINGHLVVPSSAQMVPRREKLVFDWSLVGLPEFYTEPIDEPVVDFGGPLPPSVRGHGKSIWIRDVLNRHRPERLPPPRREPDPPDIRLETRLQFAADVLVCRRFIARPERARFEDARAACEHILQKRERLRAADHELALYALELVQSCMHAARKLTAAK